MKWLWASKRNEESDKKYLYHYNELQFHIESEVNKMNKIHVMLFYCELNKLMCRKICKQSQLLTITENMMTLTKKLCLNLSHCEHKMTLLYWEKLKLYNKKNDRSVIKLNEKSSHSEWNWLIKCFNCDKIDYLMKNCYTSKRERTFTDTVNKRDLQSSHKMYDFSEKNESIDKKVKKKSVKNNSFKKKIL